MIGWLVWTCYVRPVGYVLAVCDYVRGRGVRMTKFKECIETPGGFIQVQGLPHAVRVDVGDDRSCEWTWLTLEEAERFAAALAKAIEAAR